MKLPGAGLVDRVHTASGDGGGGYVGGELPGVREHIQSFAARQVEHSNGTLSMADALTDSRAAALRHHHDEGRRAPKSSR